MGMIDSDVSQKLQLEKDLMLPKAIQIMCECEQIKMQSMNLRTDKSKVDEVRCKQHNGFSQRSTGEQRWQFNKQRNSEFKKGKC